MGILLNLTRICKSQAIQGENPFYSTLVHFIPLADYTNHHRPKSRNIYLFSYFSLDLLLMLRQIFQY